MRVLIASGGNPPSKHLLETYAKDTIIAADRGVDYLLEAGLVPSLVLGDFDSIDEKSLDFLKKEGVSLKQWPKEKDETDTHLALLEAIRMGADEIHLVGALGSRFDHTMANVALLERMDAYQVPCEIIDDDNRIFFAKPGDYEIKKGDYSYLSVLPLDEKIRLSIYGCKYPLNRDDLYRNKSMGVSNEILQDQGKITIHQGRALIVQSRD